MKILRSQNHQDGSVLATTLVFAALVGIVVGALLMISRQQSYLTARSQSWCSEIPIAEAGIEEAMAHINSRPTNFATHGWVKSGGVYFQQRSIGNEGGYYYVTISTGMPPTLVSIGYARIPLQTNFTRRKVMALTKRLPPGWGIVGKDSVTLNGTPYVDSYDSSNPSYSTLGKWDVTKRRDRAGVGTLGTAHPAINTKGGSSPPAKVYGSAATGLGGTVVGTIGDGGWIAAGSSGVQPGHATDDFNMAIPNASLPSPWSPLPMPSPNLITGITTLTAGDYQYTGPLTVSSANVVISGRVRFYVTGNFKISGTPFISMLPGATLELYMGGSCDMSGKCVVNSSFIPSNCTIYGLPTCTSMKYSGTAEAYCKVYAPQADVTITGDFDFSGSVLGKTITLSGTANIHYDEAVNSSGAEYQIISWEEL
jgi:hypothetical protein